MTLERRPLVILGATGTVGRQALEILRKAGSPLEVAALSAHQNSEALGSLAEGCPGARVYLTCRESERSRLLEDLQQGDYAVCLNAVVGAAGLPFSQAVLEAGRTLALANKESLVMAGGLLTGLAARTGGRIVPVDSEHSAIHQCLSGRNPEDVRQLILTASGGALRDLPLAEFAAVTPQRALAHPNWDMGPRITVDSATMMNKAFEILEAWHLFDVEAERIRVILHRQSVVHSMVEFVDGSILAQMGPPDMAFPIHYALHHPERVPSPLQGFQPDLFHELTFEVPDPRRYPALSLGWEAAVRGGAAGAVLNAADEIAVQAFLEGGLAFSEIAALCRETLGAMPDLPCATLEDIHSADTWGRRHARGLCTAPR